MNGKWKEKKIGFLRWLGFFRFRSIDWIWIEMNEWKKKTFLLFLLNPRGFRTFVVIGPFAILNSSDSNHQVKETVH